MSEEVVLTEAAKLMAAESDEFSITLNELADRDLTLREIALLFNNHARAMSMLERISEDQEARITTLMYMLAAYMKQYPLDIDKLQAGDMSPVVKDEPPPFHQGAYL